MMNMLKSLKNNVFPHIYAHSPPVDTPHLLPFGPLLRLKITQDGGKVVATWVEMALVGPRCPGGGLRCLQAGLELAQHGSSDGLGGGFQSMTSYKNEQLAMNTCEHNLDIGFKPL